MHEITNANRNRSLPWRILSCGIAVLLLFAVVSKLYMLWQVPSDWTVELANLINHPLLQGLVVSSECLIVICLLLKMKPHVMRKLCILLFGIFSIITLKEAVLGSQSCGCFGLIAIDPRIVFAVDLCLFASLLAIKPVENDSVHWFSQNIKTPSIASVGLLFTILPISLVIAAPHVKREENGLKFTSDGKTVLLEPDQLIGKRFPFEALFGSDFEQLDARMQIVFYRSSCSECQEKLEKWFTSNKSEHLDTCLIIDVDSQNQSVQIGRRTFRITKAIQTHSPFEIKTDMKGVVRHFNQL